MSRQTCGAVLLVLAGLALPVQAQTTLEWKFKEGDKFYAEVVTTIKQKITLPSLSPMNPKSLGAQTV